MILLVGVILGFVAGLLRARWEKRAYSFPDIHRFELALLSFLPQALVFFIPQTGGYVSQQWAAWVLPLSLAILVLFAWYNRRLPGFWLLGIGLLLNFAVITANGGLMPISPETMAIVYGIDTHRDGINSAVSPELAASRDFGAKSIMLATDETRLEWLADRFTVPDAWPIQFAYSLGDLFLVVGAFWALWTGGTPRATHTPPRSSIAPLQVLTVRRSTRE